jgi:hypothetical protein
MKTLSIKLLSSSDSNPQIRSRCASHYNVIFSVRLCYHKDTSLLARFKWVLEALLLLVEVWKKERQAACILYCSILMCFHVYQFFNIISCHFYTSPSVMCKSEETYLILTFKGPMTTLVVTESNRQWPNDD